MSMRRQDVQVRAREAGAVLSALELEILLPQLQAWLIDVQEAAQQQMELSEWCYGMLPPTAFAPLVPPMSERDAQDTMVRLSRQVQSLGPRILSIRRDGAIGTIDWSDDPGALEDVLGSTKLAELAEELFDQGLITGMMALLAAPDEQNKPHLARVGGYLRLLHEPSNISDVVALYQCWQHPDARRQSWTVRIYDFRHKRIAEWRGLEAPYAIGTQPSQLYENAPMPHLTIVQLGPDGQPRGEMQNEWPILRRELAQQLRIARSEEGTAFPMMVTSGNMDQESARMRGPMRVLHFPNGGDAKYLAPGDLQQMRDEHDRTLDRMREDMSLPGAMSLGGRIPSGEALREANLKYFATSRKYAELLSDLLSAGIADFAVLIHTTPVQVAVQANRESFALQTIDRVIALYDKGIIPLSVAAREAQPILSTLSDEDLSAWIDRAEAQRGGNGADLVREILTGRTPPPPAAPTE